MNESEAVAVNEFGFRGAFCEIAKAYLKNIFRLNCRFRDTVRYRLTANGQKHVRIKAKLSNKV